MRERRGRTVTVVTRGSAGRDASTPREHLLRSCFRYAQHDNEDKAGGHTGRQLDSTLRLLEAELRTKGDPQIVVRATVEKDVIARFETQADGSGKSFDSGARVQREVGGSVGEAYGVHEAGRRVQVADAEVVKANFAGHEHSKRT